jgi:phage terminase large subunit
LVLYIKENNPTQNKVAIDLKKNNRKTALNVTVRVIAERERERESRRYFVDMGFPRPNPP